MSKNMFLSYNEWDGDFHKGYSLDHKNLKPAEIENAINFYIMNKEEVFAENLRLQKLVDELMNELKKYKQFYDEEFHKHNSGY